MHVPVDETNGFLYWYILYNITIINWHYVLYAYSIVLHVSSYFRIGCDFMHGKQFTLSFQFKQSHGLIRRFIDLQINKYNNIYLLSHKNVCLRGYSKRSIVVLLHR